MELSQQIFAFAVTCLWYKLLPHRPLGPRFLSSRWVEEHKLRLLSSFFFGASGENTAPQEPLQDPDGLEVVSSSQVSRQVRELLVTTLMHLLFAIGPHFSATHRLVSGSGNSFFYLYRSFLASFYQKPWELEGRLCSCLCLVPPVPQSVSFGGQSSRDG